MSQQSKFEFYVGVDWATAEHAVCVLDAGGAIVAERMVKHGGAELTEFVSWLLALARGNAASIAVAIEVPHGAVVETLLERDVPTHSINPKQLDRFRDRFTVAGAKDDRRDARVLADSLRTDAQCFRRLALDHPVVIELREWSRMVDDLQQERIRLGNRIREQLRRYYAQALEVADDVDADWFADLWRAVPTPAKARGVRVTTIAAILKRHRIRRVSAEQALEILRRPPLRVAPGTTEAATAHLRLAFERVGVVNEQLRECHRRLDALTSQLSGASSGDQETPPGESGEQRDVPILRSMPGLGRIGIGTLLAEASRPLRDRDYQSLRTLSGIAPVTRQSGKRRVVVMRQACNPRMRRAMYHWARVAVQHDPACRAAYAELRGRGHSHGRALRSVGDRLLRITCAVLRSAQPYDAARSAPTASSPAA